MGRLRAWYGELGRGGKLFLWGVIALVVIVALNDDEQSPPAKEEPAAVAEAPEEPAEPEQVSSPPPEEEPPAEEESAPAAGVGDTVTVGDAEWTVTNARRATQLTSQFLEPKQGNYVVVDFTFKNNGNEAATLNPTSMSLLDEGGNKSEADTDTFGYIDPSKDIFLNQVNPGVTQQGEVIYSVAPNAQGFTLQAGDLAFFSNDNALIDLGF